MSDGHEVPRVLDVEHANAICYSGYRRGQSPRTATYPSYDDVLEDLRILEGGWSYLRLYDASPHAELVLEAIRNEGLDLCVMLGSDVGAEVSNPGCPWGGDYDDDQLAANRRANSAQIDRMIDLANRHPDVVFSVSIGNEATVDWTDHLVPVETMIGYARRVRQAVAQPVTFCENYVPWTTKLQPLADELDFISVHTYPVWEYQTIDTAIAYTEQNYRAVADHYPDKPVVVTEAGWPTNSNGRGIDPANASQELQARYYQDLMEWSRREAVLTFVFEAFDEPWKGSPDPMEPEKHWGLFDVDRRPKLVLQEFADTATES
jgi:exo-beta-1,3-glucanase (GH17 family)